MTHPDVPQPHTVGLGLDFQVVQSPDGKHHLGVIVHSGVMSLTFALPTDNATIDQICEKLRLTAAEARRTDLGLVIASTPAPNPFNKNGNPHHGNR